MGINFPNAPTVGQLHPQPAVPGVPVYRWDGTAWVTGSADTVGTGAVVRSYLAGLTLSTVGSSATFAIAVGVAADSTNATMLNLTSAYSKTTGAWAVGSGNGALDTGVIAINSWYHVHLIQRPDTRVVDVLISLSSVPTLPVNYTLFRRIGSLKTDGASQWTVFTQFGDEFLWAVTVLDANNVALVSANRTLVTLTVPSSISVNALFRGIISTTPVGASIIFTSPYETDQASTATAAGYALRTTAAGDPAAGHFNIRTDTSSRVGVRSSSTSLVYIATYGWIDRRGRDA